MNVSDHLYCWSPPPPQCLSQVRVEDDTRDALQSVQINRPSLQQRKELLELAVKIGVQFTFLGFPAASAKEQFECEQLVEYISSRALPITPILMARAVPEDLEPICAMEQRSQVLVDLFISISPLRLKVEGWDLDEMLRRMRSVAKLASDRKLRFRIAFEDSTRTPPADLKHAVNSVLDLEPECIVLNDTVGDCDPEGSSRTTLFVKEIVDKVDPRIYLAWHGHNDKGLSLANAMAAAKSGASLISGTFMGVGERAGNTPLEQFIYLLAEAGSTMYDVRQLLPMCELFSKYTATPLPPHLPLVGQQAFATSTGTHAAAILKAKALGVEFEDQVFSSVSAGRLGRAQSILIGPNSGRSSVRFALEKLSIPYNNDLITGVLDACKQQNRCLRDDVELTALIQSLQPLRSPIG